MTKIRQIMVLLLLASMVTGWVGCTASYKKEQALKRGDEHFKAGAYERARIEYLNVLRAEPQNVHALERISTIYFERGQIRAAFPFMAAGRKLDPNNVGIAFQLGSTFLASSDFGKARKEALFILEKEPKHEEAVLLLAESSRLPEDIEDTRKRLDKLQKQNGESAALSLARNSLYHKKGDTNAAEQAILKAYTLDTNSPLALTALGTLRWAEGNLKEAGELLARAAELSPLRSSRRLRLVDFKIQNDALEEAKTILKELNSKVSDHLPALAYEAKIAFAEKRFEDALKLGQKVLGYDNMNYDAMLLRARIRMSEGKNAEALKDLERLKSLYTGAPEPFYYAAVANLSLEEVDKAILNLSHAVGLETSFLPAALLLAELNLRQGDASSAVQRLAPLVQRGPKMVQPYLLLAAAYRAQDRLDDVNAVYHMMTLRFPQESDPYFLMGLTYRQQGKVKNARSSFLKAHEMNPKHVQALNQLIDLDIGEKNMEGAWKRVQTEVANDPQSADLQFLVAKLHLIQKDFTNSEVALSKVLELDPSYQPAYAALAQLYVDSKQHDMALQKLKSGVEKNPKDFVSLMKMGMIYEQLKDYPVAATTYEKLLAQAPKFAPALNNLAYIYTEQLPEMDKAYQLARKAREISPHDPFTADTLGWVLFKRGDYPWALKLIQECADRMPNQPEVMFHLGMAYYMTGAEESARAAFIKALALEKSFSGRVEAEARLAVLNLDMSKPAKDLIAELDARLETSPKDFIALLRLGGVYEKLGETDKARVSYDRAIKINPKSVTAIMTLARLYAEQLGNQAKALELAKEARTLAPENPVIVELLGPLAYQARDYSWAQTLLQKSNLDRPKNPRTLFYLGLSHFMSDMDPAHAEALVQSSLETGTSFAEADLARRFLLFADLCRNPEKAEQSEGKIKEVLASEPTYRPGLLALGIAKEKQGKFDEASEAYEKILRLNADALPVAKRLGMLYASQRKNDQRGMELLTKVRETYSKDVDVAEALGILAGKRGDFEWSVQLLKEAAAGSPKPDATLLFHLGIAQYRVKQAAESKQTLNQALALNSNDTLAGEARRILAELK